jgi:hypothetical protein
VKQQQAIAIRETAVGFGAFTTVKFQAEEIVGEVKGKIHDDPGYESDYCMDLGGDARLDPKPPFRYLNHSCEPNCELVLWKSRKKKGRKYSRLWVQALRKIRPGEELTIDYGWPAEDAIVCCCRSPRCRGWIVHADEVQRLNPRA